VVDRFADTVRVRDPFCGLDPARRDLRVERVQVVDEDRDARSARSIAILDDEQEAMLR